MGIKITIVGATGKMGKALIELLHTDKEAALSHTCCSSVKPPHSPLDIGIKECSVAIDFSTPQILTDMLTIALRENKALVIGTTGFSDEQRLSIEKAAEQIPILLAPNFSRGIYLMSKALPALLGAKEAQIRLIETHHKEKKDAPSGTAKDLTKQIFNLSKKDIPIESIRSEQSFGTHSLTIELDGEIITLCHEAKSRTPFAQGALDAAKWLASKKAGLYTLANFLEDHETGRT